MPDVRVDADDPQQYLALHRTMLAWVRTGLAMMGFGFVVARFGLFLRTVVGADQAQSVPPGLIPEIFGASLIIIGVAVLGFAAFGHIRTVKRLRQGVWRQPGPFSGAVWLAIATAVLGVAMVIYLFVGYFQSPELTRPPMPPNAPAQAP